MPRAYHANDRIEMERDARRVPQHLPWFADDDSRSLDQRLDAYVAERFTALLPADEVAFLTGNAALRRIIATQWAEIARDQRAASRQRAVVEAIEGRLERGELTPGIAGEIAADGDDAVADAALNEAA